MDRRPSWRGGWGRERERESRLPVGGVCVRETGFREGEREMAAGSRVEREPAGASET